MKKQNTLITQESTEVVLRKATNIINRTNKILKNSKRELVTHPDVMMINGLMWQKETAEEWMSWYDAMSYAKNLRENGYDDWRLPTLDELKEIISSCGGILVKYGDSDWDILTDKNENNLSYESCFESKGFNSSGYWSATPDVSQTSFAWLIYFDVAGININDKNTSYYVRCVRG